MALGMVHELQEAGSSSWGWRLKGSDDIRTVAQQVSLQESMTYLATAADLGYGHNGEFC